MKYKSLSFGKRILTTLWVNTQCQGWFFTFDTGFGYVKKDQGAFYINVEFYKLKFGIDCLW